MPKEMIISVNGREKKIAILDNGRVTELVPQLSGGIFDRCDLSFDGRRIVFAYKAAPGQGFRGPVFRLARQPVHQQRLYLDRHRTRPKGTKDQSFDAAGAIPVLPALPRRSCGASVRDHEESRGG